MITKSDLAQLEKYADKLFAAVGIDVEFTRHFFDRVNDDRNKKDISNAELVRLFKQSYKKYGKKISKLGPNAEAVINDMKTAIKPTDKEIRIPYNILLNKSLPYLSVPSQKV